MSKGNTFENDLLKLIFTAVAIANLADNASASPLVNLFVALHTADPGEAGDQTTNEATYTGYARASVARTAGGWTVSTNSVVNAAIVNFPACTGGSNTLTHWSVGVASSGASKILYSGPLGSAPKVFTATVADTLTIPGHALSVNDQISMYSNPAATLPVGITEGVVYFVKTVSGNDITISTTQGGAQLDVTAAGGGTLFKEASLAVSSGITPSFAAGVLNVLED